MNLINLSRTLPLLIFTLTRSPNSQNMKIKKSVHKTVIIGATASTAFELSPDFNLDFFCEQRKTKMKIKSVDPNKDTGYSTKIDMNPSNELAIPSKTHIKISKIIAS